MNLDEFTSLISERYYTIGKRYFKENCPNEKLPKLLVYGYYMDNQKIEYLIQGIMHYAVAGVNEDSSNGFRINNIAIFGKAIIHCITSLTNIATMPNIFYKVYADSIILHELSHAIVCLNNRDRRKYKYLPIDASLDLWKSDAGLRDEEALVEAMALERMLDLNESKLYKELAKIMHELTYIDQQYGKLTENKTNDKDAMAIIFRDREVLVDKITRLYQEYTNPYTRMVLHASNRKFVDNPERFEIKKDGTYVNSETGKIVLKPYL